MELDPPATTTDASKQDIKSKEQLFQEQSAKPLPSLQKAEASQYINERRPTGFEIKGAIRRSQSEEGSKRGATYLLDQRELSKNDLTSNYENTDELISIDVQSIALQKALSPNQHEYGGGDSPRPSRKNSDDDYFVEETLFFKYKPKIEGDNDSSASSKKSQIAQEEDVGTQSVEELRRHLLIEIHHCYRNTARLEEQKESDEDDEEDEIMEREQTVLQLMMANQYPDAEIDKLLETFKMSGSFKNDILNGEFIENDIRLSEAIRESIEDIKIVQKAPSNKSGDLDKRKFLQRYCEVAELLGVTFTVEHLLPALLDIFKQDCHEGNDKGFIKLIFARLDKLIDFLCSSQITVGYNGLRDYILPMLYDFFQVDKVADNIKQDLQPHVLELLVKATTILTTEDRTDKVLPIILDNIRDDSDEERRILGLEMVDMLAELLGQEVCQNYLMYEIVSLQDDSVYRVRKETVARMINISKVLGKEIFLRILFPVYKKLANDSIWGVRRAAVEMLPQISIICPIEIKNGILIEIFKKFSQDQSKWVKMATFQFLGPFIATYEGIDPNPLLIDYYIGMLEQNKSTSPDNEVPYHCAYNFPAVLYTLGSKSWPKLKQLYETLSKDSRWKVRRTLSFSLHEVAKLLGPDLVEKELMPVLILFMKDVEDVKEGVTLNLPKFIEVLKPEQREEFIERIIQAFGELKDWRKRVHQAQQIRQFSKVFSPNTVNKHFVPVFFNLCNDEVAEVRIEGAKATKNILLKLHEDPEIFNAFADRVKEMRTASKYFIRQTFICMCESMMNVKPSHLKPIFMTYFLEDFSSLQKDRVVNVRMQLSDSLAAHYKKHQEHSMFLEVSVLKELIKKLKLDARDVREPLLSIPDSLLIEDDNHQEVVIQEIHAEIETAAATTTTNDDGQEDRHEIALEIVSMLIDSVIHEDANQTLKTEEEPAAQEEDDKQ